MSDKAWKQWERDVAALFGGQRRGADFRSVNGGKNDVIVDGWSIECKLLSRPSWGDLVASVQQARDAAESGDIPIAVVRKKGQLKGDALVVMNIGDFINFFGGGIG